MKSYKARGIVLHTVRYGDSSLIVYLLTDLLGRQTYLVQGVRSARSKGNKAALFQPMFVVEFEGDESPHAQMHRRGEVRNAFPLAALAFDVRKSTISLFMAEVLYKLVREVEPNSPLFDFVCRSVVALNQTERGTANFHLWFLVQLSFHLGFFPGNEYREGSFFDIREGLFLTHTNSDSPIFSAANSRLLGQFMHTEAQEIDSIALSRRDRSDFLNSLLSYFSYHLDSMHGIRSIDILKEVF